MVRENDIEGWRKGTRLLYTLDLGYITALVPALALSESGRDTCPSADPRPPPIPDHRYIHGRLYVETTTVKPTLRNEKRTRRAAQVAKLPQGQSRKDDAHRKIALNVTPGRPRWHATH